MISIVYPTLDLFVYHLQDGMGVEPNLLQQSYQNLLAALPQHPDFISQNSLDANEYAHFLDFDRSETARFKFASKIQGNELKGFYDRFGIDENSALTFQVTLDGKFTSDELALCLNQVISMAPDCSSTTGSLGQTWMLSGWVENSGKDELEMLAAQAYKTLMERGWQYQEKGQFLGGTVLEFWRAFPQQWEKMERNSHLLVILYPNQKAMLNGSEFYEYWKHLFCYRNKILWAYGESRALKNRMVAEFEGMGSALKNLNKLDLAELQAVLQQNAIALSEFVNNINYLEVQQHAIDVSLHHYDKYLKLIQKKAGNVFQVSNDFKFMQEFSDIVKAKYQKQLEKDYASLRPCLDVQQNSIATIGGIIEIAQAQSDRDFQRFVGVAGVGIGSATVVAASSSCWVTEVEQSPPIAAAIGGFSVPQLWTHFAIALTFSTIAGIFGCAIGWACISRWRPKRIPSRTGNG